jgi:hypothetical protein
MKNGCVTGGGGSGRGQVRQERVGRRSDFLERPQGGQKNSEKIEKKSVGCVARAAMRAL